MQISRRNLLCGAGAAALLHTLPSHAFAAAFASGPQSSTSGADAAAQKLLAEIAEELFAEYPEGASVLGIDKDNRAHLKSRIVRRSLDERARYAAAAQARLGRLGRIDTGALSPAIQVDVDVARAAHELTLEGYHFPYGDVAMLNMQFNYRNSPYVVAQNTGAFIEIPDILDSNHSINNGADAEAYLARLESYATLLDGETECLAHDGAIGVIAPSFLLDKTLKQQKAARAVALPQWGLVTSIARRTAAMAGNYAAQAEKIVAEKVAPALDRQIAELERHRARATQDAGSWKLPDGDAYYAWALRASTTTRLSPDEIHTIGLEQIRDLQSQMDVLLRAQGMTKGSVGERLTALGKDPRQLFPNNDEGRAEILAYINDRVARLREKMPLAFATLVPGKLVVKRVPVEIEAGMPGGYASAGTIDGSVPGTYYINLRDTSIWPRHALPSLTYHEGLPGHIWQYEYTYKMSLLRSLLSFNAYTEGWALYAEQLADELGAYEDDPLGRLGYLQSIAFRACRLVVDTGIHAKRWTREQAVQWFATTNGSTVEEVSSEVDRYCAWPGQACGYKVGHNEINRLRDKAKAALGQRFDLRQFNDATIMAGGVPLTVLEQIIDRHIAERKA